jgi:hypothetical protein
MTDLKPDETIFRYLFESPAYFVGECDGDNFLVIHAFKNYEKDRLASPHNEGSNFAFSLRATQAETPPGAARRIERYQWVGEDLSALLGIFYGKLVYNLGQFESAGLFCVPSRMRPMPFVPDQFPFNSARRKPDGPELNLAEAKDLITWYLRSDDDLNITCLLRAAEFYRLALESYRAQSHIALTLLCSAIEAVLPLKEYSDIELYDPTLISTFRRISEHLPKGGKVVNGLKQRLFQVKRKVAALVGDVVPESFFEQRETKLQFGLIRDRTDLINRIKQLYDIRSRILHTGDSSGTWYLTSDHDGAEIGFGVPMLDDKDLQKTLVNAMTLTGLERLTFTVLHTLLTGQITTSVAQLASGPEDSVRAEG